MPNNAKNIPGPTREEDRHATGVRSCLRHPASGGIRHTEKQAIAEIDRQSADQHQKIARPRASRFDASELPGLTIPPQKKAKGKYLNLQ